MKTSGLAVVAALCAALAARPGFAQEDATKAGSDQGAPRADGGSVGDGAIKDGADTKGVPAGAGQNPPREGETARPGLSPRAGSGIDSSRKGIAGAMGVTGTPSGSQSAATLDNGVSLTRPNEGLAALLRRANRKALIAATPHADPRTGPPVNSGAPPSSAHPGGRARADGGAMRNAIGVVVSAGTDRGADGVVPGSASHPGIGASAQPGAIGISAAAGNVSGGVRPSMPLNAATGPAAHAAGINGTTMGHIASGPGSIGGPVKDRSAINGTTIRPKH